MTSLYPVSPLYLISCFKFNYFVGYPMEKIDRPLQQNCSFNHHGLQRGQKTCRVHLVCSSQKPDETSLILDFLVPVKYMDRSFKRLVSDGSPLKDRGYRLHNRKMFSTQNFLKNKILFTLGLTKGLRREILHQPKRVYR